MVPHLEERVAALADLGWTGRDAEWIALVCLHSGVFLRSQYLSFCGQRYQETVRRFLKRCGRIVVEQPWNGTRGPRLCRIVSRPVYRALGAEHVRHRREAGHSVLLRRLLSLDYVLEHTDEPWLPTEVEKVAALSTAGIPEVALPRRRYAGESGSTTRYFAHKLPLALADERATFVFMQAEDETPRAVRTWGRQHAPLWSALRAAGRTVEVVVAGRAAARLAAAQDVLDSWMRAATGARDDAETAAARAEIERLRDALVRLDHKTLDAYGGLNGTARRIAQLEKLPAGRLRPAIDGGRTWRSRRVPA